MAKIVVTNLNPDKRRGQRADGLKQKRVRGADGKQRTVYVLETQSPDVGEQLRTLFQLNVNRARRRVRSPRVAAE